MVNNRSVWKHILIIEYTSLLDISNYRFGFVVPSTFRVADWTVDFFRSLVVISLEYIRKELKFTSRDPY